MTTYYRSRRQRSRPRLTQRRTIRPSRSRVRPDKPNRGNRWIVVLVLRTVYDTIKDVDFERVRRFLDRVADRVANWLL